MPDDSPTDVPPDLVNRSDSSSEDTDGSQTVPTPTVKSSGDDTDVSSKTVPTPTDTIYYDEENKHELKSWMGKELPP